MGPRSSIPVAAALAIIGCGRIGYEPLPSPTPDDGSVGPIVDAEVPAEGSGPDASAADASVADASNRDAMVPPDPARGLIDDLEDGDCEIRPLEGRVGGWYTVNDGSPQGMQTPEPDAEFLPIGGGARGSEYAAGTEGGGFTSWGAALGVQLHEPAGVPSPYDASSYQGLRFRARGTGLLTLSVTSAATVPEASGGSCPSQCFDYYAIDLTLSDAWTLYEFRWDQLAQKGWGAPVELDPAELLAIEFAFGIGADFELGVDDLSFF